MAAVRSALVLTLALAAFGASARDAAPLVADPALEARVMQVAQELRCLVCQNETLADSQADLAVDLRQQIRQRLQRGESPAAIDDFMVARYGEFVRYRPAFSARTALLWVGPFVLLVIALGALVAQVRGRRRQANLAALTPAELQRVNALRAGTVETP